MVIISFRLTDGFQFLKARGLFFALLFLIFFTSFGAECFRAGFLSIIDDYIIISKIHGRIRRDEMLPVPQACFQCVTGPCVVLEFFWHHKTHAFVFGVVPELRNVLEMMRQLLCHTPVS
jgi:hypothetical protein